MGLNDIDLAALNEMISGALRALTGAFIGGLAAFLMGRWAP